MRGLWLTKEYKGGYVAILVKDGIEIKRTKKCKTRYLALEKAKGEKE